MWQAYFLLARDADGLGEFKAGSICHIHIGLQPASLTTSPWQSQAPEHYTIFLFSASSITPFWRLHPYYLYLEMRIIKVWQLFWLNAAPKNFTVEAALCNFRPWEKQHVGKPSSPPCLVTPQNLSFILRSCHLVWGRCKRHSQSLHRLQMHNAEHFLPQPENMHAHSTFCIIC